MLPERCKKPRPKCAIGRTGSLPINPTNLLKFLEQTQSKLQIRQLLPAQNCFLMSGAKCSIVFLALSIQKVEWRFIREFKWQRRRKRRRNGKAR